MGSRIQWHHLSAEIPPEVEGHGPEAVQEYAEKKFEEQSQALHGTSYAELKELVEAEAATALEKLTAKDQQDEATRTAALTAAAESVFQDFPAPAARANTTVAEGGDA
jgi:hypothetical protein